MENEVKKRSNVMFFIWVPFAIFSIAICLYLGIGILTSKPDDTGLGAVFVLLFYLFSLVPFIIAMILWIVYKVITKKANLKDYKKTGWVIFALKLFFNVAVLALTLIYIFTNAK